MSLDFALSFRVLDRTAPTMTNAEAAKKWLMSYNCIIQKYFKEHLPAKLVTAAPENTIDSYGNRLYAHIRLSNNASLVLSLDQTKNIAHIVCRKPIDIRELAMIAGPQA